MKLDKYLSEKHQAAMRRQIRKLITLIHNEDALRKIAQYASKVWLAESGGELIEKDGEDQCKSLLPQISTPT